MEWKGFICEIDSHNLKRMAEEAVPQTRIENVWRNTNKGKFIEFYQTVASKSKLNRHS